LNSNNNNSYSKLKCNRQQSQAVLRLRATPEWEVLSELINSRFEDAQSALERADEKNFRFEQGRLLELRFFLELEDAAKAVLDKARSPKRITAID
jgi:hypothetical protein